MKWTPGNPVRLQSRRFVLRSASPRDVTGAFMRWQTDRDILVGLNQTRPHSRDYLINSIRAMDNRRDFNLMITPTFGNAPIGYYIMKVETFDNRAESTVVIGDRSWWGKDVVTETRARLLDFVFDEMGLHKMTGHPHARNLASIFNYKAMGFRCEAVLKEHLRDAHGPGYLDAMMFSILADEWRERRAGEGAG